MNSSGSSPRSPGADTGASGRHCPRCWNPDFSVLLTGTDRLYQTTHHEFQVVECEHCGMMRLYPLPDQPRVFYPDRYWWAPDDSVTGRLERIYRTLVLRDHVRFVLSGREDGEPVLDVGCGGGSFLAALQERGLRVVGVDGSRAAAKLAWQSNGVPAVCCLLGGLPFLPRSFGIITLFHVLEHLSDPQACLENVHRLLTENGRLYVQVPNASSWQFLLLGERWSGLDLPRHLIQFRAEDLEDMLGQCGFRVLRLKHFSLRDNPAGLATSLFPGLDPMSRRVRGARESAPGRLLRNLLYFAMVTAALPFTALEAAVGAGSTILVEAAKK